MHYVGKATPIDGQTEKDRLPTNIPPGRYLQSYIKPLCYPTEHYHALRIRIPQIKSWEAKSGILTSYRGGKRLHLRHASGRDRRPSQAASSNHAGGSPGRYRRSHRAALPCQDRQCAGGNPYRHLRHCGTRHFRSDMAACVWETINGHIDKYFEAV